MVLPWDCYLTPTPDPSSNSKSMAITVVRAAYHGGAVVCAVARAMVRHSSAMVVPWQPAVPWQYHGTTMKADGSSIWRCHVHVK